jgi:hypothetical protein
MGCFYTNYTLRGVSQQAVTAALAGRKAFISPTQNGCVVAFDQESDKQDQTLIARIALQLSKGLHCVVLAVLIHDDDILWYRLCEGGRFVDEYDSTPGYFDPSGKQLPPKGGDAQKLSAAFGVKNIDAVDRTLRKPQFGKDGYVFASDRHADLVRALKLPEVAVRNAYDVFASGEYPEGFPELDMMSSGK